MVTCNKPKKKKEEYNSLNFPSLHILGYLCTDISEDDTQYSQGSDTKAKEILSNAAS